MASITRAMLLAAVLAAGCGGNGDGGAMVRLYHLEAQIRGPVDDGDVTCGEAAVFCPGASDGEGRGTYGYAVAGDPELTEDDVFGERAQALVADVSGQAAVMLDLTREGAEAFHELTRRLAVLGRERGSPQHVAVVVGDELVSVAAIDYQQYPEGLTGETGVQIAVATVEEAQRLAHRIRGEN